MIDASLSQHKSGAGGTGGDEEPPPRPSTTLCGFAEQMLAHRRKRNQVVADNLLGEPVWDMLLDLFVVGRKGQKISVSSAYAACNVPESTAQRYLRRIEAAGHVVRHADPNDRRRILVSLSPQTDRRLGDFLRQTARECQIDITD